MSISGKFLSVVIGSSEFGAVWSWEVDEGGDQLDATSSSTGGATDTDMGPDDADMTINWYIDTATGKYAPLRRGTILTNLKLYRRRTDGSPAYTYPLAIVVSSRQTVGVKERIMGVARVKNKGTYSAAEPPGA